MPVRQIAFEEKLNPGYLLSYVARRGRQEQINDDDDDDLSLLILHTAVPGVYIVYIAALWVSIRLYSVFDRIIALADTSIK